MDRADLRKALIVLADDIISRTWLVSAENRRIARAARTVAGKNDVWVDTLLEEVNVTYRTETPDAEETEESLPQDKPTLVALASEIGGNLKGAGYSFSITVILAIIGVLVGLYQACKKPLTPAQAAKRAAKPRWLDRVILRRIIREHAGDTDADALEGALYDAGTLMSADKMKSLYAEVKPREE